MPWKFPSPSHPLYSSPDELCLAVPISGMTGEGLRSSYVALQASPFPTAAGNQSQFSSPVAGSPLSSKPVIGKVTGWRRSKSRSKSKLPPLPDPSPRRPLYSGPLPVSNSDAFAPTPDLTFSTDTDSSFSSLNDSFNSESFPSWFDLNSPLKPKLGGSAATDDFPDTPIRRSNSSSILEELQLARGKDDERDMTLSSTTGPIGLGLGFKFDLRTSYGTKRPRGDAEQAQSSKAETSDESGSSAEGSESKRTSSGDCIPAVPPLSDDEDANEELDISELLPLKRRRLFD